MLMQQLGKANVPIAVSEAGELWLLYVVSPSLTAGVQVPHGLGSEME